jgi:hypothetical protein
MIVGKNDKSKTIIIVNLTPHDVTISTDKGIITFPPYGKVVRCKTFNVNEGELEPSLYISSDVDGVISIPITSTRMGDVTGLPSFREDTYYIVSRVVAEACKDRDDHLLIPNESIRDSSGRIIGYKSLARIY